MNIENIQKLIDHYSALPKLLRWGYVDCAAGVLADLGLINDRMSEYQVAGALGVSHFVAVSIIAGSFDWISPRDGVERRDSVIAMFEGLLEGKGVDWNRVRNAPKN